MARNRPRIRRSTNGHTRQRAKRTEVYLAPATIEAPMLRQIDSAIPESLRSNIRWEASTGDEAIQADNIENFLEDTAQESKIEELTLEAWDHNNSIYMGCDSEGSYFECRYNTQDAAQFTTLTHAIEGEFKKNHRWTAIVPRPIARPKRVFRASNLAFGSDTPSFFRMLNWQKITEDIISRLAAHALTGIIAASAGGVAGFFAGRWSA